MQTEDPRFNLIRLDAHKAYVALESVLQNYFDSATPDTDAIRYDFSRISTMLNIALDYIHNIQDTAQEKGESNNE